MLSRTKIVIYKNKYSTWDVAAEYLTEHWFARNKKKHAPIYSGNSLEDCVRWATEKYPDETITIYQEVLYP